MAAPQFPIYVAQQPLSQFAPVGQTATFTLVASGAGVITYQWQTTNHRIALLSGLRPAPGAEVDGFWLIVGAVGPSYTTPVLQAADNGSQFQCFVQNLNIVPQSVGNLPNSQLGAVPTPFTTPQRLFSVLLTQPAVLTVQ